MLEKEVITSEASLITNPTDKPIVKKTKAVKRKGPGFTENSTFKNCNNSLRNEETELGGWTTDPLPRVTPSEDSPCWCSVPETGPGARLVHWKILYIDFLFDYCFVNVIYIYLID